MNVGEGVVEAEEGGGARMSFSPTPYLNKVPQKKWPEVGTKTIYM